MTDTIVGTALWADLVRQIAVRTRNCADTDDLLHTAYRKLVRFRAPMPADSAPVFPVRTAINKTVNPIWGSVPGLRREVRLGDIHLQSSKGVKKESLVIQIN